MKGRRRRHGGYLSQCRQAGVFSIQFLWNLFQLLDSAFIRFLRVVLGTLYLPGAIAVCSLGAYLLGDRLAPYVVDLTDGSFLGGVSLSFWERVCRCSLAVTFAGVGWTGYKRHKQLTTLRVQHEFTYERYREIVTTPGSRLTDFLWAYVVAALLVNVPVGLMVFIIFILPFLITDNWLFRFFLIVFLSKGIGTFLNGGAAALMETFRPRRLEAEVQGADKIVPRLEGLYQRYLAEKEARERLSDEEIRNNDW